jgi:hypothetical protein
MSEETPTYETTVKAYVKVKPRPDGDGAVIECWEIPDADDPGRSVLAYTFALTTKETAQFINQLLQGARIDLTVDMVWDGESEEVNVDGTP